MTVRSEVPGDVKADEEAVRLTTQPKPVGLPRKGDLFGPLRIGWRQLTSMRTALLLLFLLALASVPGGFLPQRRINPLRVNQYIAQHPTAGPLMESPFQPTLAVRGPAGSARWLFGFIALLILCQLALLSPMLGNLRLVVRVAVFGTSLVFLACIVGRGRWHVER